MATMLANDFSWSLQRYIIFQRCKKEYFYHYYASWHGWDERAEKSVNLIYRLKNITIEEVWLKSIVEKTLIAAIGRKIAFSQESCKSFSLRTIYKDIFDLERQEYLSDPKKLCLDIIYFNRDSISSLKKRVISNIEYFWNVIWKDVLFVCMTNKPYGDFIKTGGIYDFVLDNIKIWVNPGIVYAEKDKKFIINIFFRLPKIEEEHSLSLVILFLNSYLKGRSGGYIPHTIFFYKNKCVVCEDRFSISEISDLIRTSSCEMLSYLTFDKKAYFENFPKTNDTGKCYTCRFKEVCVS